MKAPVLTHYDPDLPLRLAGDASAYSIGAAISHVYPDGSEQLIAFVSHASKELHPSREGGIVSSLWNSEVPAVSLWAQVCAHNRTQTSNHTFRSLMWYSYPGSCMTAKVGLDSVCMLV